MRVEEDGVSSSSSNAMVSYLRFVVIEQKNNFKKKSVFEVK